MNPKQVDSLIRARLKLQIQRTNLNARVLKLSNGRPHHQACFIGGLSTGMAADLSGSPCWCGVIIP